MPTEEPQITPVTAEPVQLDQHAQTVRRLADRVEHTYGAARQVTMDLDAYGRICAVIPLMLVPLQARITATLGVAAADLQLRSEALQGVAAAYEQADTTAAARHESILHRLTDG
ncbi:type VII secretion target [Catellatospora tritici]|uniref:type VII secretion target n=1 Tax=Catellatospora tritici TaxID=2851566 RepID=UPI001C2D147D|nr:type VII secretion target [Catellatospora tritici]MBV1852023.1 hypothetical protein [Catellatospora tritici]